MSIGLKLPPHHFEIDGKLMRNVTDEDYFMKKLARKTPDETQSVVSRYDSTFKAQTRPRHFQGLPLNDEVEGLA